MNTQEILKNLFASLAAILVLAGCATPYHSTGFTGGYSDTQFAPDFFRVVFRGNGYTSTERAQDFALLRASELTLKNGFTCFAVIDEQESTSVSSYTTPGHADTTAYGTGYDSGNIYLNPYGGSYSGTSSTYANATTTYTPPQTYVFYKPKTGLLIRAFTAKPAGIFTFDAAFLQRSLTQKYRIKTPSSATPMLLSNSDVGFSNAQQTNTSSSATTNEAFIVDLKAKAKRGDAEAQFSLGVCYYNGEGVPQDVVEAMTWHRKAAEQGLAKAQFFLGHYYDNGEAVSEDKVEAAKWYRKAAEQGYAEAQFFLGCSFNTGQGVPQDYVEAYKWYNLAGAQGNSSAITNRDEIVTHMTPEQIAEAQRLSREFTPHKETLHY